MDSDRDLAAPTTSARAVRIIAALLVAWTGCLAPVPRAVVKACVPLCKRDSSCSQLDARLLEARKPLLRCVGVEAKRGNLSAAHRCYRSLRLLESARWWLETLTTQDQYATVYQPADSTIQEFLCRIEALSRATTADQVERIYQEMIRSYP